MQKRWIGVCAAFLLGGCASVEMAKYAVTSFAEVPLKEKARIKVVANSDNLDVVVNAVKSEFLKKGNFTIVEENADYWLVLRGARQYAESKPLRKVSVVEQENSAGGAEIFAEEMRKVASAAMGISVAVYDSRNLDPVYYFEIPIYSGDNGKEDVRDDRTFYGAFVEEVRERISDIFITQNKQIETPIPLEADENLRRLFIKGGDLYAKEGLIAYRDFLKAYKAFGTINLEELCEQLRTDAYKGSDADLILSNYYLYLLVEEAMSQDPVVMERIRDDQLAILRSTEAKGLAEAIPVALARLEYKLANIGE